MTSKPEYCPKDAQDLAEIIAQSSGPMMIEGGGTRPVGRMGDGPVLSTRSMSGVVLYEPGALTLVAQAGTPMAEVEALLDNENQQLAFEPMDHRVLQGTNGEPTLGGVFASNTSGPRRVQVGAARDFALGVRFVDGAGQIAQNGGRVMKNVTGYDLVKLMCGSWGTLGVMSELSCKVLPKPETSSTLKVALPHWGMAVPCLSRALGTPYDVNGAAAVEEGSQTMALVRVEGFEQSVAYRVKQLRAELSEFGDVYVEQDRGWQDIRDVTPLKSCAAVWCVKMRPSRLGDVLDQLDAMHTYHKVIDWGGAKCWIGFDQDQVDHAASYAEDGDGIALIHQNLQHNVGALGGHVTLFKGAIGADQSHFQPEAPAVKTLSDGLRRKFDPRGILNPGRMG